MASGSSNPTAAATISVPGPGQANILSGGGPTAAQGSLPAGAAPLYSAAVLAPESTEHLQEKPLLLALVIFRVELPSLNWCLKGNIIESMLMRF